jgi:phospholipase/carboxylesterase
MGHGILDSIVDIETGRAVFTTLKALNYNIQWHDYVMEHSVCNDELGHISVFINELFA